MNRREEANFTVDISYGNENQNRPQYWLTGLSLGLIPSWGTDKDLCVISFEDRSAGGRWSYSVDQVQVNHLILTPVFWVSFITTDLTGEYRKALKGCLDGRFHEVARK